MDTKGEGEDGRDWGGGVKEAHAGDHTSETRSVGQFSVAAEEAMEEVAPAPRHQTVRLECRFSRGHV